MSASRAPPGQIGHTHPPWVRPGWTGHLCGRKGVRSRGFKETTFWSVVRSVRDWWCEITSSVFFRVVIRCSLAKSLLVKSGDLSVWARSPHKVLTSVFSPTRWTQVQRPHASRTWKRACAFDMCSWAEQANLWCGRQPRKWFMYFTKPWQMFDASNYKTWATFACLGNKRT